MARPWLRSLCLFLTLVVVSACSFIDRKRYEHVPEFQDEAGSTSIAVLSVAPWEEYVEALQPTFDLKAADALALAAATTQASEDRLLDALALTAKLAPPTSTTTSKLEKAEGKAQGAAATDPEPTPRTFRRTDETKPGDASTIALPTLDPSLTTLPSIAEARSPLAQSLALEPMLKYSAATALYQEVRLLDRYVKDAVQRHDYKPYVVRMQISSMPFSRHQPIDAYTLLSFFAGDGRSGILDANVAGIRRSGQGLLRAMGVAGAVFDDPWSTLISLVRQQAHEAENAFPDSDAMLRPCDRLARLLATTPDEGTQVPFVVVLASGFQNAGGFLRSALELQEQISVLERADEDRKQGLLNPEQFHQVWVNEVPRMTEACREVAVRIDAELTVPPTPYVIPLLVTDDLERSAAAQAADQARQMAFGLQILAQGTSGFFGGNRLARRLQTVLGSDYNSLLTVARVTDNSYRVRLGAMQQVGNRYALVPRTHNVTFLLLVPKTVAREDEKIPGSIQVLSRTELRKVRSGELIPARRGASEAELCESLLAPFECHPLSRTQPICNSVRDRCEGVGAELTAAIFRNDFGRFKSLLGTPNQAEHVWLVYASALSTAHDASTNFELPVRPKPEIFCQQAGVVIDKGEGSAQVTLRGAARLAAKNLSATLLVTCPVLATGCLPGSSVPLLARSIAVADNGREATFTFPSATELGLTYSPPAPYRKPSLVVDCPSCQPPKDGRCAAPSMAGPYAFDLVLVPKPPKPTASPSSNVAVRLAATALVAREDGTGKLAVRFDKQDGFAKGAIAFEVEGADVTVATAEPGPESELRVGVLVGPSQTIVVQLELRNLRAPGLVTVRAREASWDTAKRKLTPEATVASATVPIVVAAELRSDEP